MLGYTHESFWDQTPRTLSLTWQAHKDLDMLQHNERAWLAWHVAALNRTKKMPPLRSLLEKLSTKPRWEEELEGLKRWVKATGGKVIQQ